MILDGECEDDENLDPCDDDNPPVYCDKPCPEEEEVLKVLSESQVLQKLWLESFGEIINGNLPPQAQRAEKGGWLVEENGEQKFVYFPEETTSSFCSINNVPPPPPGAVAVIHTHPIYPDERIKVECYLEMFFELYNITDPVEKAEYYESGIRPGTGASNADKEYAKKYKISAYYMDGENVEKFYDGTIEQEVKEKEERCGY